MSDYLENVYSSILQPIQQKIKPFSVETSQHLNSVFSNSVSDKMVDHNGDIDVYREAVSSGVVGKTPMTLLHFDTHSDMYRNDTAQETLADYVNRLAADGAVNEIYWVIPDEIANSTNEEVRKGFFVDNPNDESQQLLMFGQKDKDGVLYIKKNQNKKNAGFTNVERKDYKKNPDAYRVVKFHRLSISELPSFKGKDNLFVDIDADYFSNSGDDTIAGAKVNFNPDDLERFARILDEKGVKAKLTTMALSPSYCEQGDKTINNFFNNISDASKIGDLIFKHGHFLFSIDSAQSVKRDLANKEHMLTLVLDRINSAYPQNPLGEIGLNPKSPSYKLALEAVMKIYNVDEASAKKILSKLDASDSEKDGIIRYMDFEEDLKNRPFLPSNDAI